MQLFKIDQFEAIKQSSDIEIGTSAGLWATTGLLRESVSRSLRDRLREDCSIDRLERADVPCSCSNNPSLGNYGKEVLAKAVLVSGEDLTSRLDSASGSQLDWLRAILESDELRQLAQLVTGWNLTNCLRREVMGYSVGDYQGPHTDHHPEDEYRRNGYVDVHISFCEPWVKRQLLVAESINGHLNNVVDVARDSLITVHKLPFWHYITPLEIHEGGPSNAIGRWIVMATFGREIKVKD